MLCGIYPSGNEVSSHGQEESVWLRGFRVGVEKKEGWLGGGEGTVNLDGVRDDPGGAGARANGRPAARRPAPTQRHRRPYLQREIKVLLTTVQEANLMTGF